MRHLDHFYLQKLGIESGPKIVFLHGLMGSAANWRKIIPAFVDSYQILVFDQRGHGKSFHPISGFSPEDYAQDLEFILDQLGWEEKIHLVGHSLGGRNALSFAHRLPSRINKLVIEDIGPDRAIQSMDKIEFYLNEIPTPFVDKKAAKEFLTQEFPGRIGGGKMAQTLAQYFYTNIESKKDGQADWRFSREAILASMREGRVQERWDEVRELKVPTLWVRGQQSEYLTREVYERVLASNAIIQGVEIEGAGHWVHFDQPEAFIRALQIFFAPTSP